MCCDRTYRVKALHGMLPTASRLLLTHPDLYKDDLCPCCLQAPETTTHLWQCLCAQSAIGELAAGGYALFWKLVAAAQSSPQLTQATIFPGPHSITDVIQGIVPLEWVLMMHKAGLTMDKAQSIASRVGAYFVTTAKAQIWNP